MLCQHLSPYHSQFCHAEERVRLVRVGGTKPRPTTPDRTSIAMMQEILALLSTFHSSDDESQSDERFETEVASPPVEMQPPVDPLPYPSESDRIQEPTPAQFVELKKRMRTKLASRRYTRRRKADTKAQVALLSQQQEERSRLQVINSNVLDTSMTQGQRQRNTARLRADLGLLLRQAEATAGQTFDLYEQAERMVHPQPRHELAEHEVQPDHLSVIRIVFGDSQTDQLDRAITNVRTITAALSDTQRQSSPEFSLTTFNGWRITEWKRRGPRFVVQASKQIMTISRHALSENVWRNADDENKRVVTCAYYARFVVLTPKDQPHAAAPRVFYSEELHEFPAPFQCRAFTSLNGAYDDTDKWYYVKHSVCGKAPKVDGRPSDEIVGVILQDGPDGNGGNGGVHVELVMFYDTHSVCHAQQLVCEDPPVCHRVLSQWERNHGVLPPHQE